MAADGEVEIAVRAEGTDEAADELSDGSETGVGGGGGGGAAGIGQSLKSIVKLLGVITAITRGFEPVLKMLEGILTVASAFLAPLSIMMMRLLAPVLRLLLKILPYWYDFMNWYEKAVGESFQLLRAIPGKIWSLTREGFGWLNGKLAGVDELLQSLPRRIWEFVSDLPRMIADGIASKVPGVESSDVSDAGRGVASTAADAAFGPGAGAAVNIALNGGLDVLVDRVEKETGLDFP